MNQSPSAQPRRPDGPVAKPVASGATPAARSRQPLQKAASPAPEDERSIFFSRELS